MLAGSVAANDERARSPPPLHSLGRQEEHHVAYVFAEAIGVVLHATVPLSRELDELAVEIRVRPDHKAEYPPPCSLHRVFSDGVLHRIV